MQGIQTKRRIIVSHLDASKRFDKYKKEEKKETRTSQVEKANDDLGLKELRRVWRVWKFPEALQQREEYKKYNELVHHSLEISRITPEDIEKFSVILPEFQEEAFFHDKSGLFLSAAINLAQGMDFIVHLDHLNYTVDYLGFWNVKNIIVKGSVGDSLGLFMREGMITIEGNAGSNLAEGMMGGKIIIDGNCGDEIAKSSYGGEIHIHGDHGEIFNNYNATLIYHKGVLITHDDE